MSPMRIVGRYALFDEIASGGMASIHLGRLLGGAGFTRTVAIKRMHEQFAREHEFVTMFMDEARVAARVRHPNVVTTLDVVENEGQLFVVMEYVHGSALSTLIRLARKSHEAIPLPIVAAIVAGALRGLHAAHEATDDLGRPLEIVHRDVSPQNILVGVDGVPRVIDFGVAKATGRLQTTHQGQLKGKVPYMSPEQVSGKPVSRRSDVYSAGAVLAETLVLRRLFEADNEAAIITMIREARYELPSHVDGAVPPIWDTIVARALAQDPNARYSDAREMAQAIEAVGPVATAAEVGEWVERVASDTLCTRKAKVAEVESSSQVRIPKEEPAAPPSTPPSQISSISVTATPSSGHRVGVVFGVVGVIALLGAAVVLFVVTRSPAPAAGAAPVSSDTSPEKSVASSAASSAPWLHPRRLRRSRAPRRPRRSSRRSRRSRRWRPPRTATRPT
ncbi:MAG: serine/threonine protein kinase [Myxococcales bacterium]|nr:serine/threonine protein kinase [Myxococcales bacterium]